MCLGSLPRFTYWGEAGFSLVLSQVTKQAQRGQNKLCEVTSSFPRSGNLNSTCWSLGFPLAEAWHCDPEGGFAMDIITDALRGCKSPQGATTTFQSRCLVPGENSGIPSERT